MTELLAIIAGSRLFYCPEHTAFIEESKTNGYFRD